MWEQLRTPASKALAMLGESPSPSVTESDEAWAPVDEIPALVWTATNDGTLTFLNRRFSEFAGIDRQRPGTFSWTTLMHPDDLVRWLDRERAAHASGEPYEMEFRLLDRSERYVWHLSRVAPARRHGDRPPQWIGLATDVDSQREEAEAHSAGELRFLSEVGEAMQESLDLPTRLERFVQAVVPRLADWASVNLIADDGSLETVAIAHRDPAKANILARLRGRFYGVQDASSGTPEALRTGRPSLMTGVDEAYLRRHIRVDALDDVRALGADSAFVVPLAAFGRTYGTLAAMRVERERGFSQRETWLITELARRAAFPIANSQLYERSQSVADAFQHASLPSVLPRVAGLRFCAFYAPGSSEAMVGGDWYDAFRLGDGRVVLSIGDVSGSGLGAAVVMGAARQLIRGIAQLQSDASFILGAADRALRTEYPDQMVTAFVGILDPLSMTLSYAGAGHPPPLLRFPDQTLQALDVVGLPLGLRQDDEPAETTVSLASGTLIVLYTDGLTESTRDVLEGEQRLRAALSDPAVTGASDVAKALRDAILTGRPLDDVALLTVEVREASRWRFDCREEAAARSALAEYVGQLRALGRLDDDYDGAATVFVELVGNAVRHAPGPVDVAIEWTGARPVLHVIDEGPGFRTSAPAKGPSDLLSESGRGLFLVSAFTEDFEVSSRRGAGSHARAVLRIRRRQD
jgi:PAS domain S-box-containing protein